VNRSFWLTALLLAVVIPLWLLSQPHG